MQGPGENTKSDSGAQGNNLGKPGSNAQTAMDLNRQKQIYFDQIAETEYGKQRLRIIHELAFLNQTHKKGKFPNSDEAINGITAWLAANPYAEAGDLLDILNKWLRHAKKDESSWSSDGKIFPDKLEAILWRAIVAFIRQLDRKEINTSLNAGPGSEAERLMHIARIQELEASEKLLRDSERQMESTLHEQTTLSSLQKQKLESNEQEIARLISELAATKEALTKITASATTLEAEKARSTAEKEAHEQVIAELKHGLDATKEDLKKVAATAATLEAEKAGNAVEKTANEQEITKLRQELGTTKDDLKMVSSVASKLEAEKARNDAEKAALAKENAELKNRLKTLDEKLQTQEGAIAQVSHTILERVNAVAEQSRRLQDSFVGRDRDLSDIFGVSHDDSRAGSSLQNRSFSAPLPKKVTECLDYIQRKQLISPTRLHAIISLGRFLSALSSGNMSDFAVEGVIKLTSNNMGSFTPEYFIRSMLEQILRLEKALDTLKSELQRTCESQPIINGKEEDLMTRDLHKALFLLFKGDAFNVRILYEHFDKICTQLRTISSSQHSRSNSEGKSETTKDDAGFVQPALPAGTGFFPTK